MHANLIRVSLLCVILLCECNLPEIPKVTGPPDFAGKIRVGPVKKIRMSDILSGDKIFSNEIKEEKY